MRRVICFLAGAVAGCVAGYLCEGWRPATDPVERITVRSDTVRVTDTVRIRAPVRWRERVRTDTVRLATVERDTCLVTVPIEQRIYEGERWRAVISGWRPSLDSLMIDRQEITRTIRSPAPRWSVGIQAGYGLTPRGFQPYIGAGVTMTIRL